MKLYAISDLHLSGHSPKPMDVFGKHWEGHWDKIKATWRQTVSQDDAVLLPGDISWAMTLEEARIDLDEIADLPGQKILLRGNHDYWWNSINRVRAHLPQGMLALQNDAVAMGAAVICGTRGWTCPGSSSWEGAEDDKIYKREVIRLKLTLDAAAKLRKPSQPLIAMLHFPPFNERQEPSGFTELLEQFEVTAVVYGHLHGVPSGNAFEGLRNGVMYHMVSCDYMDFTPKLVYE
jgi:uncharacterized protein